MLLIIIGVLVSEVVRLRKECKEAFLSRDRYRIGFAICKAECDRANLKPDLRLVTDLLDAGGAPA